MTFRQKLQSRAKKQVATSAINKFTPYDVILAPIVTEKTYADQDDSKEGKKYFFKIHKDANKNDVKQAVQYLYNVTPMKVNVLNVKYKKRQQRGLVRKAYKKAIITLGGKDKIDIGS